MKMMDFGVLFALNEHKSNISSKLWDYLQSNLSILGIVPEDGAMAKIINDGKCGYILPYDIEQMISMLKKALDDYKEGKTKKTDYNFVKSFSREKMVNELVKKLEELCIRK